MATVDAADLARFGANIRAVRERSQLSQEALALEAGLHPTEVNRIERGRRNPGLLTILKLARGLSVPAAELMHGF